MRPMFPERLDENALRVNKKTKEELMKAPDQKLVWNQFIDWVHKFNKDGSKYNAPIACGKNIRGFDLLFVDELNKKHSSKKEKTVLFSTRTQLDLEDFLWHWFEQSNVLINPKTKKPDFKMDTVRPYFGLSTEGAHSAMVDVVQTGALIMKFLKLYRTLNTKICFKDSMKGIC